MGLGAHTACSIRTTVLSWGLNRQRREVNHLPSSGAEVKNEQNCLNGVDRDSLPFSSVQLNVWPFFFFVAVSYVAI